MSVSSSNTRILCRRSLNYRDRSDEREKEELLLKNGENHKQQFCLYILMDGRIKNDQLFQIALNRLQKLKEEGVKLCLRMVDNIYCEACQKLKDIVEDTQRCC